MHIFVDQQLGCTYGPQRPKLETFCSILSLHGVNPRPRCGKELFVKRKELFITREELYVMWVELFVTREELYVTWEELFFMREELFITQEELYVMWVCCNYLS